VEVVNPADTNAIFTVNLDDEFIGNRRVLYEETMGNISEDYHVIE